ncbi:prepilin-type N-terminal cleavage/methylation domain-containing protein [Alkalihalobacterium bogoriense]
MVCVFTKKKREYIINSNGFTLREILTVIIIISILIGELPRR